jgi:carboxypeptidase C (cathepsin A)
MKTTIVLIFASVTFLVAQTPPLAAKPETATAAPPPADTSSRTKHEMTVNGAKIPYTATAGTLVLKKEDGKPWASMFYVAYTRDDTTDLSKRPITFSFNGGPGFLIRVAASWRVRAETGRNGPQR